MDLVTRLRYRSSTDVYPTDTALTLMAEAADLITQLRGNLSLAEEGLANYAQENAQLRALLTQAPIAKVTVRESFGGDVLDWVMCAPGLPPGEHDLYLMPSVPQSAEHP